MLLCIATNVANGVALSLHLKRPCTHQLTVSAVKGPIAKAPSNRSLQRREQHLGLGVHCRCVHLKLLTTVRGAPDSLFFFFFFLRLVSISDTWHSWAWIALRIIKVYWPFLITYLSRTEVFKGSFFLFPSKCFQASSQSCRTEEILSLISSSKWWEELCLYLFQQRREVELFLLGAVASRLFCIVLLALVKKLCVFVYIALPRYVLNLLL